MYVLLYPDSIRNNSMKYKNNALLMSENSDGTMNLIFRAKLNRVLFIKTGEEKQQGIKSMISFNSIRVRLNSELNSDYIRMWSDYINQNSMQSESDPYFRPIFQQVRCVMKVRGLLPAVLDSRPCSAPCSAVSESRPQEPKSRVPSAAPTRTTGSPTGRRGRSRNTAAQILPVCSDPPGNNGKCCRFGQMRSNIN